MSIRKSIILFGVALSLTAFMNGCGSSNKEGTVGDVAKVDETLCAQCHGSAREKLTGRVIYDDYAQSVHALNTIGCQDCHGGGAAHNGVGPIPFPSPNYNQCRTCHNKSANPIVSNYSGSKHLGVQIENEEGQACQRCHTHQGAVLAAQFGFTGDGTVMAALVNAPGLIQSPEPIKCNTCHVTHKPQELRVDAGWAPSVVAGAALNTGSAQYKLCTQCHTFINPAGKVAGSGTTASGTVKVGHHETSWYRAIATTHYDNPATGAIEGYGVDTTGDKPCFDCHDHESRTNSNNDPGSSSFNYANKTIYTDWAQSAHAGKILTAKFAAARSYTTKSVAQVDAVMAASSPDGQWTGNRNTNPLCVRCHTETGFKEYLTKADVTATTPAVAKTEILTCRGCHENARGALRTLMGTTGATDYTTKLGHTPKTTLTTTGYALAYGKKAFPDVKGSNLCITCHDGRTGDPASQVTNYNTGAAITTPGSSHDLPAAATMYVKMGFLNLSTGVSGTTGTAYLNSLKSDQDGGTITSTHRKLGTPAIIGDTHADKNGVATFATAGSAGSLASNGPCVACHLTGSHSLLIDQAAVDAVCSRCHPSEGTIDITSIANFQQHFLEPQFEVFQNAIGLAYRAFNAKQNAITFAKNISGAWTAYSRTTTSGTGSATRPVYTSANFNAYAAGTGNQPASATAADYTAAGTVYGNRTKMFGALGNVKLFVNEPASYAHARTYTRRLLYDCIDFLDDGILNMSVGATAVAIDPVMYVKGATQTSTNTSESMSYLLGYNRTTGAWIAPERP